MSGFRKIDGYPYLITETGEVISLLSGKQLAPDCSARYLRVYLHRNGVRHRVSIHRLVAQYYCYNPDPSTKIFVNHIDGNPRNNHYTNLEWCTPSENNYHAFNTGLKSPDQCGHSFRSIIAVDTNNVITHTYRSAGKAARAHNCSYNDIDNACRRNPLQRVIAGYRWGFEDQCLPDDEFDYYYYDEKA